MNFDHAICSPRSDLTRRGALASLGALTLAACGQPSIAGGVLRVGSQKGGDKSLMLASGVLQGAPYRIEWSDFAAAQTLLEAIAASAVDIGVVGDAPFLFAYSGGAKIKAVFASASTSKGASTAVLKPRGGAIHGPSDLRGKRIATGRGSIGHYLLLRVLERAGLGPDDVTIVFLSPSDAKAAFATGAVDAWSTWAPYLPMAVLDGSAEVLVDGRGLLTGYGFQVASESAIAAKRVILQDYLARLARAQRWALAHQAEYAKVLADETGLPLVVARRTVELNGREPQVIDFKILAEEVSVLRAFQAAGAIKVQPNLEKAFDASFKSAVGA